MSLGKFVALLSTSQFIRNRAFFWLESSFLKGPSCLRGVRRGENVEWQVGHGTEGPMTAVVGSFLIHCGEPRDLLDLPLVPSPAILTSVLGKSYGIQTLPNISVHCPLEVLFLSKMAETHLFFLFLYENK